MACYPTPGYKLVHGDLRNPPELTGDERKILHEAAKLQNKNLAEEKKGSRYTANPISPEANTPKKPPSAKCCRCLSIISWTEVKRDSDESIWLERPGKHEGSTSANLKLSCDPRRAALRRTLFRSDRSQR